MECGELLCRVTIKNEYKKEIPERSVSQGTFLHTANSGKNVYRNCCWKYVLISDCLICIKLQNSLRHSPSHSMYLMF